MKSQAADFSDVRADNNPLHAERAAAAEAAAQHLLGEEEKRLLKQLPRRARSRNRRSRSRHDSSSSSSRRRRKRKRKKRHSQLCQRMQAHQQHQTMSSSPVDWEQQSQQGTVWQQRQMVYLPHLTLPVRH